MGRKVESLVTVSSTDVKISVSVSAKNQPRIYPYSFGPNMTDVKIQI